MPEDLHPDLTIVDHPLVEHKLSLMRDERTPNDVFRGLMRDVAYLIGYEALRSLPAGKVTIRTPVARMQARRIAGREICFVSILRAAEGFLPGLLDLVPDAVVGHIGMKRDEKTLRPARYYFHMPRHLDRRRVFLLDPMLATGHSAADSVSELRKAGARDISFICLLAAPEGIRHMAGEHPGVSIVTGALDERLDDNGHIVPGLGDAGDRLFGTDWGDEL